MANTIKGLTVEIGGDTTKLGKALADVDKQSRGLSKELSDINKLLKLDPGNTDLLAQKQKVLTEAIGATKERLDTLKEAQKQVQEQFERGEISEAQYRALQREIVSTEQKLDGYESELGETEEALDGVKDATNETTESSGKMGSALKAAGAAAAAALAAAATAAVALGKQVVQSYADYEQLVGGVETLFGAGGKSLEGYAFSVGKSVDEVRDEYRVLMASQNTLLKNAENAYKTAGLSANEYMETATSFSASLISSLGGDTYKAAQYADMAITDMADNANKMGTDMASIQNAYQGFAKQNYTMLDNLKLGYGGTKEEMERLLADAEAISGIEYDVSSYADVVSAIHVIQEEMGVAGATADEAEGTISGSLNMLKGALQNLVTGLGDADANIGQLAGNVTAAFSTVLTNITPVINNLVSALPSALGVALDAVMQLLPGLLPVVSELISQILSTLVQSVPMITSTAASVLLQVVQGLLGQLPAVVTALLQMVNDIMTALTAALPGIVQTIVQVVPQIINGLVAQTPALLGGALQLLQAIVDAIPILITDLVGSLPSVVDTIVQALTDAIPLLLEAAIQLLMAIVDAIPVILESLIDALPTILDTICKFLVNSLPQVLNAAIELLMALIKAIPTIMQALTANLPKIISTITSTLIKNLPLLIDAAVKLLMGIVEAIPQIIKELVRALPSVITAITTTLSSGLSAITNVGKNLITGLWNGIKNMTSWITDKVKGFARGILDGIKSTLGIHSPSKEMAWVGEMMDRGLAGGIEDNAKKPLAAMADLASDLIGEADSMNGLTLERNINASYSPAQTAAQTSLMTKLDSILGAIERGQILAIDGDALVGATAGRMDTALGQRRILAARGAV